MSSNEISFDIVAENGNNVEAIFDIVERIVQFVAFDIVADVDGALTRQRLTVWSMRS